jgi:pyruvate,orthophosphate dikinase
MVVRLDGSCLPDRELIGGKAWSIARMQAIGITTPPAVVVTTDAFRRFHRSAERDDELFREVDDAVQWLEEQSGRHFGGTDRPLLVSVRSGAAVSMPGMMDTVLNLGITDAVEAALARESGDAGFARDTHRRFLSLYTEIVLGHQCPDLPEDQEPAQWRAAILGATGASVPQVPAEQLRAATRAVFASWNSRRARRYRSHNGIPDDLGTAVTIQAMVFGNLDDRSGTGVLFSRNPLTGEPGAFGEYLSRAQGEDVVSGRVTPDPLDALRKTQPEVHDELLSATRTLEIENGEVQDIEFTVQHGRLYLLQSRAAKLSAAAVIRTSVDLAEEGLVSVGAALRRISAEHVRTVLAPRLTADERMLSDHLVRTGESACPGVGVGLVVTDSDEAERLAAEGRAVVLARPTTSPEDVNGMLAAQAVVTEEGGTTSHAAVVSRALGVPCVVGCGAGTIAAIVDTVITVDGGSGRVFDGVLPVAAPTEDTLPELRIVSSWAAERTPVVVVDRVGDDVPVLDLATLPGGTDPERVASVLAAADRPYAVTGGAVACPAGVQAAIAAGASVIVASPTLPVLLTALRVAGDAQEIALAQPAAATSRDH